MDEIRSQVPYEVITIDLFDRYPELYKTGFDLLNEAYDSMSLGYVYFWDRGDWSKLLVQAWLHEHQPDLSASHELHFADFSIRITPRDFNNDGEDEYVLDVTKGEPVNREECLYKAEVVQYLVVRPDYQFIDTPLFWYGYGTNAVTNFGEGGELELRFEDINADLLPEWIVASGGETFGGPGSGYVNTGHLYVLAWRNDQLVDLTSFNDDYGRQRSATSYEEDAGVCHGPIPRDVSWQFTNADDDPALEILQEQIYLDNWFCESRTTRILDWDSTVDRYRETDIRKDFPQDTQNCTHRQAEEAMWRGEYEVAIELYERALTLESFQYTFPDELVARNPEYVQASEAQLEGELQRRSQYMRARLALAYILTGKSSEAEEILQALVGEEFTSEAIEYFVTALAVQIQNPLLACLAAYDVFTEHFPRDIYGDTIEQSYGSNPTYDPGRVGCAAPKMLLDGLNERTLTLDESPVAYLESMSLSVRQSIVADFNDDGQYEWLIWLDSLMPPFFFAPEGDHYAVTQPMVDSYRISEGVETWRLPGQTGTGLVYLNRDEGAFYRPEPWACVYQSICGGGGGDYSWTCASGSWVQLTLWRMQSNELVKIFDRQVCATDLSSVFPESEGSTLLDGGTFGERTMQYLWNENTLTYEPSPATPTAHPAPRLEPPYNSIWSAFANRDYAYVAANSDSITTVDLTSEETFTSYYLSGYYLRALALEALNRSGEALAEYVAIYEGAPESAWGMLAALHLERVGEGETG